MLILCVIYTHQTICANSSSASDTKYNIHFPPFKVCFHLRPYCTWCITNINYWNSHNVWVRMKYTNVKNELKTHLPFWLLRDGAILTFSALAIASAIENNTTYLITSCDEIFRRITILINHTKTEWPKRTTLCSNLRYSICHLASQENVKPCYDVKLTSSVFPKRNTSISLRQVRWLETILVFKSS